jgi:quinol-cytochrome oxidoreductase complex cytochrome b subunit
MAEAAREKKLPVDDKIHTWPHLVRMEFLITLFVLVGLTLWALTVDAPLEEPANPTRTPNPSKAPWYFLGLQEMLVYFDPWHAGVVLPSLIIVGLMVIPYMGDPDVFSGLSHFVDYDDHDRYILSGSWVEPFLALAKVGSTQGCGVDQRRPALPRGI